MLLLHVCERDLDVEQWTQNIAFLPYMRAWIMALAEASAAKELPADRN